MTKRAIPLVDLSKFTEGTPEEVRLHPTSHTAKALRDYAESMGVEYAVGAIKANAGKKVKDNTGTYLAERINAIQIINAKEHKGGKYQNNQQNMHDFFVALNIFKHRWTLMKRKANPSSPLKRLVGADGLEPPTYAL